MSIVSKFLPTIPGVWDDIGCSDVIAIIYKYPAQSVLPKFFGVAFPYIAEVIVLHKMQKMS